jgi:DNA invertase Pin-like site-specific DNA recombinase
MGQMTLPAVAYLRISSAGQLHGHGFQRQEDCVRDYAQRAGFEIVSVYCETWTGTEADRPAFAQMMAELLTNGTRIVIIESLDRLARDLGVQIALIGRMVADGITLISASTGEDVTESVKSDPMREAMVLVQGVFAQVEKKRLVLKLKKSRDAQRSAQGRCEGIRGFGFLEGEAATLKMIRSLRRKPRGRARRRSWQKVADFLNAKGIPTRTGAPWGPDVLRRIAARNQNAQ